MMLKPNCSGFRPHKRANCKDQPLISCWVSSINPCVDEFYCALKLADIFYEVSADDWPTGTTELTIMETDKDIVFKLKEKFNV